MGSKTAGIVAVSALGLAFLLWPVIAPADAARRGASVFRSAQGQEVVGGSYSCNGTVYTDDQDANIGAYAYLSATSGITDGYYGAGQSTRDVPADLDRMAEICAGHVEQVVAQVPEVCTLGPVVHERSVFGNGSSAYSSFDFSCQGTRDQVIGVIGGFGRLSLTALLR